jgi:phosphoglycolate phosphatase
MRLRAIFFDLDGTLLDTLGDIAAACNHAMRTLGQPSHPPDDYRLMVGEGADVLVRRALPADRQHLADEALRRFKEYYVAHAVEFTQPYAGIAELLDGLVQRHIALAVVTNKPQINAQIVVDRLLDRWPWFAIAGERQDVPKKPDPTSTLRIASRLGIAPGECGFLGDSHIDMRTAQAAGMLPIGAAWGFRGSEELDAAGAKWMLRRPTDLLPLLD